jgi:nicotinamidase-related amidase
MGWEDGWKEFELADRSAYRARLLEELVVDPAHTAVVTIDAQYNYLDPEIGGLPVLPETARHVVASTERLLSAVRGVSIPVIHAYTVRRQIEIDRGFFNAGVALMQAGIRNRVSQLPHAPVSELPDRLEGSRQAQVIESFVQPEDLHVTTKRTMDSFQYTELDMLLNRVYDVDTVILTGINTDTCVYSAAFSAANRGLKTIVVSDCVASTRGTDSHLMALEVMSRSIAWVLTVEQLEAKLTPASA